MHGAVVAANRMKCPTMDWCSTIWPDYFSCWLADSCYRWWWLLLNSVSNMAIRRPRPNNRNTRIKRQRPPSIRCKPNRKWPYSRNGISIMDVLGWVDSNANLRLNSMIFVFLLFCLHRSIIHRVIKRPISNRMSCKSIHMQHYQIQRATAKIHEWCDRHVRTIRYVASWPIVVKRWKKYSMIHDRWRSAISNVIAQLLDRLTNNTTTNTNHEWKMKRWGIGENRKIKWRTTHKCMRTVGWANEQSGITENHV